MENYFKEIYENPMRDLNNVTRYSGVFCIKPESDGYHTIDMMAMCMKISEIIESRYNYIKIDKKDLIYRCYLHDMDESLMGDISRVVKYYNDDIYKSVSHVANSLMTSNYGEDVVNDIKSSKDINNLCGLIVKVSDTLQSSIKIYEECKLGNFNFRKIIEENVIFIRNLVYIIKSSKLYSQSTSKSALDLLIEIVKDFENKLNLEINQLSI